MVGGGKDREEMREILFRGKRKDNGEWVEGFYFCMVHDDGRHVHHFIMPLGADLNLGTPIEKIQVEIDIETLCQYTGLTDKNGNKIWENDIVKCNYNDYGEKGTYIGKVIFREDTCTFIVTDEKSTDYEWWNEEKEVIGNIFDNHDLLKGE